MGAGVKRLYIVLLMRPRPHGEIPKVLHVLNITLRLKPNKLYIQPYLRDTWETKTNLKTINNESLLLSVREMSF